MNELPEKSLNLAEVGSWGLNMLFPYSIKVWGEAATADAEAAASYPEDLAKTIHEGGYNETTDFQHRQIVLYWKKMPCSTSTAREEKSMPGFKTSEADSY